MAIAARGTKDSAEVTVARSPVRWLRGPGCVPVFHRKGEAATCEITHIPIWQGIKHPRGALDAGAEVTRSALDAGAEVTAALLRAVTEEGREKVRAAPGPDAFDRSQFDRARAVGAAATRAPLADFLTPPASEHLV